MDNWFWASGDTILRIFISTFSIYLVLLLLTRLFGVRSYSQMSSFDFVITLAIATTFTLTGLSDKVSILQGAVMLFVLYLLQWGIGRLRRASNNINKIFSNQPLLLMEGEKIIHKNLKKALMTEDDLYKNLRLQNVTNLNDVHAVIIETTGKIAVLYKTNGKETLDKNILKGIKQ